jgi:succinyl-CoA synthetase beta subunit
MNVHEYQAAAILSRYGVPVNPGEVATTPDEVAAIAGSFGGVVAVKSQVHTGGRGKAGGIAIAKNPDEARSAGERIIGMDIRGHTVNKVLVAAGAEIAKEYYLGVVLDRPRRQVIVMASAEGGVEIEEVAAKTPEKIIKINVDPMLGLHPYQARALGFALGIDPAKINGFATIVASLVRAY